MVRKSKVYVPNVRGRRDYDFVCRANRREVMACRMVLVVVLVCSNYCRSM